MEEGGQGAEFVISWLWKLITHSQQGARNTQCKHARGPNAEGGPERVRASEGGPCDWAWNLLTGSVGEPRITKTLQTATLRYLNAQPRRSPATAPKCLPASHFRFRCPATVDDVISRGLARPIPASIIPSPLIFKQTPG